MTPEHLPEFYAITEVDIWNADGIQHRQDIVVENGLIKAIGPSGTLPLPAKVVSGLYIGKANPGPQGRVRVLMPSGVDAQVHLRTPGQPHKDTPENALRAALWGGVGAVLAMPNTKPVVDSAEVVKLAYELVAPAEKATGVRAYFSAAMTKGQRGEEPVNVEEVARAGAIALTDDGRGVERDEVMRSVFKANAAVNLPLLQHAEVPGHGASLAPGPVQRKLGLKEYPSESEWKMVERDLELLKDFPNQRYHVLHVSSRRTLDLIQKARALGLKATGEASPHHLLFSSDDIPEGNTSFKMNPPLRSPEDREALRAALADGRIEFVATDQAPHEVSAKGTDFEKSAFGTTGLEAMLRVLILLHNEGHLKAERLVEVFSTAPARFLGIDKEFGAIKVGRPLRAILVDPQAPKRPLVVEELQSLSKNSCFIGAELPGKVAWHINAAGLFRF